MPTDKKKYPKGGGPQPNAGRKHGSKTKRTIQREMVLAGKSLWRPSDELPHEFCARVMRGDAIEQFIPTGNFHKVTGEPIYHKARVYPDIAMRLDAAKTAAPYFAPKLSPIEVQRTLTDAEVEALLFSLLAGGGAEAEMLIRLGQEAGIIVVDPRPPAAARGAGADQGTTIDSESHVVGDEQGKPVP